MIQFDHVSKTYPNGTHALNDVSLQVEKGEFVFIVGHSGAGKSTLIKMLLREEIPTTGSVEVNGYNLVKMKRRQIPLFRRGIGVVFQDFRLIPTMTVYDNVAFALRVTDVSAKFIRRRVPYILDLVDLSGKAKCMPQELSGGEQQRVALARALVNNPSLLIADEPTGNIDPQLSYEIVDLLSEINKCGTTVLMVTHEHELVHAFPHRIIEIRNGTVVSDSLYADDSTDAPAPQESVQPTAAGTAQADVAQTEQPSDEPTITAQPDILLAPAEPTEGGDTDAAE